MLNEEIDNPLHLRWYLTEIVTTYRKEGKIKWCNVFISGYVFPLYNLDQIKEKHYQLVASLNKELE